MEIYTYTRALLANSTSTDVAVLPFGVHLRSHEPRAAMCAVMSAAAQVYRITTPHV